MDLLYLFHLKYGTMIKIDDKFNDHIYFYLVIKKKFSKEELILDAGFEALQYFDKYNKEYLLPYFFDYTHLKEYNVKKYRYCVENNQIFFTESQISLIRKKLEEVYNFNRIKKLKKVINEGI